MSATPARGGGPAGTPGAAGPGRSVPESKYPPFPAERAVGLLLFGISLALYLATLCWDPCPGLPTQALLTHLGVGPAAPGVLDPLWGWLVRGAARLPGLSLAGWTGLFSAISGAACVSLMGRLMTRVNYRGLKGLAPASQQRAIQARGLSGCVAGLYLACCTPFWVVSTRSLPGAFHLLLLLGAAWEFSEYQRRGSLRHLGLLGLLLGIGITEFATFIVFLPLAGILVVRELIRRRMMGTWRPHLWLWGGLLLGLSLYPIQARALFWRGAPWGLFASPWSAWGRILQEQIQLIVQVRYSSGFLIVLLFSIVPWLMLFAMSRRSPWFYESDQVAVRLVFVGGLMAVLFNAPFAPWRMLGMGRLMVTPYVVLASCVGFMAGEFWILGELHPLKDDSVSKRIARAVSALFACLLPVLVLAGGVVGWPAVDGRHSGAMHAVALQVLDRLEGRDIVFSNGLLDDSLALAIWERKSPVQLIGTAQMQSPLQLRRLARGFAEPSLREALQRGDFSLFIENLFRSDAGIGRAANIDMPDIFRGFGYLVPDGFLYRIEPSADRVDLSALVEAQRPEWRWMEQVAAHPAPRDNLARPHQDLLRLLASKTANNLGLLQAERGDAAGALETLRAARRIYPENLSALLNLLALSRGRAVPEEAEWVEEWEARQDKPDPFRWALSGRYGYVWNARERARRAGAWILSGAPASAGTGRRQPSAPEYETDARGQLLDHAYLQWGKLLPDEHRCRARLVQDEKDLGALMDLCRLSLRRIDPDIAELYRGEAVAKGMPEQATRFDRAMALFIGGDRAKAVEALEALAHQTPSDVRVWMALVLLTGAKDSANVQALKTLKNQRSTDIGARLALAWVHLSRLQWADAQAELEAAIQMDSKSTAAWELMATLASARGHRKLMETSLRTLLALDPGHPFQRIQAAYDLGRRGAWAEAEAELRAGLRQSRNPDLLDALAGIIMAQDGDLSEARALVDEAVRKQPFNPMYRCSRSELNMQEGNYGAAEQELRRVLKAAPTHVQAMMGWIRLHQARGEIPAALDLAEALSRRSGELSAEQRSRLEAMIGQMRNP